MLCDLHFYRLYDDYTMKKAPIDIGDILGISLSTGPDQALAIHCAVSTLIGSLMRGESVLISERCPDLRTKCPD